MQYITSLPTALWEQTLPRGIVLLGSTGSIGVSTLKVIAACPDRFCVVALAGGRNVRLLSEQAQRFRPGWLGIQDEAAASALRAMLPAGYTPQIVTGQEGYAQLAALPEASTVLSAQVGAAGLRGTLAAARAGKVIALANKESLVLAGRLLRQTCQQSGAVMLPVDSEHNAIFQALYGRPASSVRRVILTASGGPFRGKDRAFLQQVTPEQALQHPNWSMGAKITIDSATLMNKGLEVIEAHHLYQMPSERIGVLVHPQSLVHSLVEFNDGSLMAQLGTPDMRMAISHCINWPEYADCGVPALDLARAKDLTFEEADLHSFPCLALARQVLEQDDGYAVTLNAANELAVDAFLHNQIGFMDIPSVIQRTLEAHNAPTPDSLKAIEQVDEHAREQARQWIARC